MKIHFGRLGVLVLAAVLGPATAAPIGGVANHWLANTGGTGEGHIANFLTDMIVYYPSNPEYLRPLAITASFWDEGSCGFCSYHEGKQVGKAEWWRDTIHSDRAWSHGKKCSIGNFWGRAFLNRNGPPPVGALAPFVACDGHDTLRTVVDPTAVAFDMAGNLLVADNGPDQNVKIYSLAAAAPRLLRTFGDSGGVFAGPVPGRVGTRRFWGIRGLGVDSQGNVYVGNTGIPMQTMGGTDIRVFSGRDSSLLWQVQGLAFVNMADADPQSNGTSVFIDAKRMAMDYSKPPGESWSFAGVTLDPFRYPHDPRIVTPQGSVFLRRLEGKLFQFSTNMTADFIAVHRFEAGSEIAIPTAFICLRDANVGWGSDSAPAFDRSETNKRMRWYWIDTNGDGIPQRSEYSTYDNFNIYSQSFQVDARGNIWAGGEGAWSAYWRGGGISKFPFLGLANGIPRWRPDSVVHTDIPFSKDTGVVGRLVYLPDQDAMFLGVTTNYFLQSIRRYDHWSDSAKRSLGAVFDLGYNDLGASQISLDQNTAAMTIPMSFTADSDYVYVAYLDRGRDARVRGEVTVYGARDGKPVGWITPGPETGEQAGAIDLIYALNARTQADGHKVLFVEEDGFGKVEAYRWCPSGAACSKPTGVPTVKANRSGLPWRVLPGLLEVKLGDGSHLDVRDLEGRALHSAQASAKPSSGWHQIPLAHGVWLATLSAPGQVPHHWRVVVP